MPKESETEKGRFIQSWDNYIAMHGKTPDKYVQTSTVPDFNGSLETIMFLAEEKHAGWDMRAKIEYVLSAYDDDLRLIRNPQIRIKYWEFTAIED